MSLPDLFKDSYAPVAISIQYQEYAGASWFPIPWWDFLVSLQIKWGTRSAWNGTLTLFDREEKFLSGVFLPGRGAMFRMKWGWDVAGGFATAPTFNGRILTAKPDFKYEGIMIVFELMDEKIVGGTLDRDAPPRKFAPGFTASELAKQIAQAEGWIAQPFVIEDSVGVLDGFVLGGETRWQFLQNTIMPRARNDKHEAYVCYFDDKGAFHFHSPSFTWGTLAKSYIYGRDPAGELMDFTPTDNNYFSIIGGVAGDGAITAIDSNNGKPIEAKTTASGGVQDPNASPGQQEAANVPTRMQNNEADTHNVRADQKTAKPNAFAGLIARTPEEAATMSAALHARRREFSYTANATAKGTHDALPNDNIEVAYYTSNSNEKHYLSGVFRVAGVEHTLDSSGWRTAFENLQRQGLMLAGKYVLPQNGPEKDAVNASPQSG